MNINMNTVEYYGNMEVKNLKDKRKCQMCHWKVTIIYTNTYNTHIIEIVTTEN